MGYINVTEMMRGPITQPKPLRRYAGFMQKESGPKEPIYVDYPKRDYRAAQAMPAPEPAPATSREFMGGDAESPAEPRGYRYDPEALMGRAKAMADESISGLSAAIRPDEYQRQVRKNFGKLQLLEKRSSELMGREGEQGDRRARLAMEADEFGWKRELRPQEMMKGNLEIAGKQVGLAGQIQEAELRQAQEGRAAEGNEYEKKNRWLKENETLQQMEIRHANELREHEKWQAEKQDRVKGMPVPETPEPGAAPGVAQGATPGTAAQPLPPIMVPADARKLPKGSRFRTPDGREMVVR